MCEGTLPTATSPRPPNSKAVFAPHRFEETVEIVIRKRLDFPAVLRPNEVSTRLTYQRLCFSGTEAFMRVGDRKIEETVVCPLFSLAARPPYLALRVIGRAAGRAPGYCQVAMLRFSEKRMLMHKIRVLPDL